MGIQHPTSVGATASSLSRYWLPCCKHGIVFLCMRVAVCNLCIERWMTQGSASCPKALGLHFLGIRDCCCPCHIVVPSLHCLIGSLHPSDPRMSSHVPALYSPFSASHIMVSHLSIYSRLPAMICDGVLDGVNVLYRSNLKHMLSQETAYEVFEDTFNLNVAFFPSHYLSGS